MGAAGWVARLPQGVGGLSGLTWARSENGRERTARAGARDVGGLVSRGARQVQHRHLGHPEMQRRRTRAEPASPWQDSRLVGDRRGVGAQEPLEARVL